MYEIEKLDIEKLQKGQSQTIAGLRIISPSSSLISVTGWSRYKNLDNVSREIAESELNGISKTFNDFADRSPEVKKSIKNREIEYSLDLDYDHGAVRVCSERNDKIEWFIPQRPPKIPQS